MGRIEVVAKFSWAQIREGATKMRRTLSIRVESPP